MLIIWVRNMARTDNINSPSLVYDQRKLVEESKELSKKSLKAYTWSPCDDADEGCLCVIAESSKEAKKIGYHYWCSGFMGFDGEYKFMFECLQSVSEKILMEVKADGTMTDGIPSKTKVLGILPNEL